jgi:hypothetical protein
MFVTTSLENILIVLVRQIYFLWRYYYYSNFLCYPVHILNAITEENLIFG